MIEKIMKAVKSSNKKRGRNITIGAVVGMLLSCTAVMSADNYLWIKNDGEIKFSTDSSTPANIENPYGENTWDEVDYVNNIALNSTSTDYGLKLEGDLTGVNFINNGLIGSTRNSTSYGIYNNSGSKIGNIINTGSIIGTSTGSSTGYGIYNNGTIGDIINIGSIIGMNTGNSESYGIYNNYGGHKIGNIINNGLIAGVGERSNMGIYICGGTDANSIYNTGLIIGKGEYNQGIYIQGYLDKDTINDGVISSLIKEPASSANNYEIGIYGKMPAIKNNGLITGRNNGTGDTYGVYNQTIMAGHIRAINTGSIINTVAGTGNAAGICSYDNGSNKFYVTNSGLIAGAATVSGAGYGIFNRYTSSAKIETIVNTGVIYGETSAIKNFNSQATITSIDNYGILVTKGSSVIDNTTGGTITNTPTNYGLYITGTTGVVTVDSGKESTSPTEVVVGYDESGTEIKRNMTIKNAPIATGGTSTNSLVFSTTSNEFDNSILNGKNDTLKVSGTNREVKGSIINAYGTAVVFNGTDSQLTLSGTIVNGGADGTNNSITGSGNGDTLILQAGDITYVGTGSSVSQNTVINGNIDMKAGDDILTVGTGTIINGKLDMGDDNDTLTIKKGAQINGTLDGGSGDDTLDFGGTVATNAIAASNGNEIRIQHDILNYETINVNSNVTLFEKTVGDDGSLKKLDISGVNEINISAGSVLNLRIDTTKTNGRYEGHALFGNTALTINGDASKLGEGESITESENGTYTVGVLNLVTNGLGLNSIIAMDGITLDEDLFTKTNSILDKAVVLKTDEGNGKKGDIRVEADKDIFREVKTSSQKYEKLNDIYNGVISSTDDNFIALKNIITINNKTEDYTSVTDSEQLAKLLAYLGDIYTGSPYSYSSELSRKSAGMFRDIVTENEFRPNQDKWLIMGGFTHADGGTKDTYYGRNYHGFDTGTSDTKADMKLTGAYMLAKYGYSENTSLGLTLGGNKSEAEISMSKVKGNSGYLGVFAENYRGNLTLKAGAGVQYSEYDADRSTLGGHSYSDKYSDMTYNIYLNGRYSHQVGDNLFLEPYATLSYTYIDQDGANEGSKTLAIETDSKSFDYTVGKVGVDLKKVIPHEKGKSTLSAGVSYTKILDGADEEHITGRFKGGSNFDILVAHKNEHSIGLNAKYALELENGILFDVKGTYSVERDSHNQSGKNKTKGEWIVGAGLGYKF
ncbi:hypothetical protein M2102_002293 [Fusobacterium sp. PH5-7]|uniref:autotransporter domain-containing protein n=1 Tax=Fusobacterium sp. PH5-7 TaxID=2940528 RepID=UPI002476A574|nr:autotransporter outer membrane beta-barrel domain-containing protein [Fusobacterium sp. PH5-7]MDH6458647.1 hypothetical protein [Fusobacterium sp. PH5-7]